MMFLSSDSVYEIGLENALTSSSEKENLNFKYNYALQHSVNICLLYQCSTYDEIKLGWLGIYEMSAFLGLGRQSSSYLNSLLVSCIFFSIGRFFIAWHILQ